MTSAQILAVLVGVAGTASGWIYSATRTVEVAPGNESVSEVALLEESLAALEKENDSLRSLVQGGGDVPVSAELQGYVEDEMGLVFPATPRVRMAGVLTLYEVAGEKLDWIYGEDHLEKMARVWELVGLIPPEQSIRGQLSAVLSEGAVGVTGLGEVLVEETFDEESIQDVAALVGLLAADLYDQIEGRPSSELTDDERWAWLAEREARVQRVVAAFQARQARAFGSLGGEASGGSELLESLPEFVQLLATFPSRYALVGNRSTASLMRGGESVEAGSLGQLGLAGLLARVMDEDRAVGLSAGWVHDELSYDAATGARWTISLSDDVLAKEVEVAARESMGANFPEGSPIDPREWAVERSGLIVEIRNAPPS